MKQEIPTTTPCHAGMLQAYVQTGGSARTDKPFNIKTRRQNQITGLEVHWYQTKQIYRKSTPHYGNFLQQLELTPLVTALMKGALGLPALQADSLCNALNEQRNSAVSLPEDIS